MNNVLSDFSDQIASTVERAAASVVQVQGHRRPAAGVVVADGLILTPAAVADEHATVRDGDGHTHEGVVLGRLASMGLSVVRVEGLKHSPLTAASEPRVGHIGIAVGRTWSGGVMATLTSVAVVGGPLRTGRGSSLERVIRIQQAPHGALTGGALVDPAGHALGVITSMAIRGTTVVIPASLAWEAGARAASGGGARQGFLGVSSLAVQLPERQRGGRTQEHALLVSHVVSGSPADVGGLLVGDLIVAFDGQAVEEPEELAMRLNGNKVGQAVLLTVVRGAAIQEVTVTVGDRPRG